jgi:hypothetical protein
MGEVERKEEEQEDRKLWCYFFLNEESETKI